MLKLLSKYPYHLICCHLLRLVLKMADDDEIDILGDFSFNSCFAQNNQGIPSCSDREDTVHPQWLLDSTATNWYDTQNIDNNRLKEGPSRKLSGNSKINRGINVHQTVWSQEERLILKKEMVKYGRNVHKISETLKTKTEAEIQALIEAEHGIHLDAPGTAHKNNHNEKISKHEIINNDLVNMNDVLSIVATGAPTIPTPKKPFKTKNNNKMSKKSLLKPKDNVAILLNSSEIFYEDDLVVGSMESVGSEIDTTEDILKNSFKQQKEKMKIIKKMGNHRRKVTRNYDKGKIRNKSKDNVVKSPQGRQRKDSSVSDESVKSPKMQIVLGSGLALPVSEGEQVIKIEKKKNSECESDIEVDIDSDSEITNAEETVNKMENITKETPIAVPLRKFEPMPKRNRKIHLDGGGGYTIMHTESGDLYEIGQEPRKERQNKKTAVQLIPCRFYNSEKPAPFTIHLSISALITMDVHAHTSRGEVMGLLGGVWTPPSLRLRIYRRVSAAAEVTHCDMDPVSQAQASEWLTARGAPVVGWHHSHPRFPPAPSAQDLRSQRAVQALRARRPLVALISSQGWAPGRRASVVRCFRTEDNEEDPDLPLGYQLNIKLVPDLTSDTLTALLDDLRDLLLNFSDRNHLSVNMVEDVCPLAGLTFLEKCISSIRHHMRSAGYEEDDPLVQQLVQGLKDIFR